MTQMERLEALATFDVFALAEPVDDTREAQGLDADTEWSRDDEDEESETEPNPWPSCRVHVTALYAGLFGRSHARHCAYSDQEAFERSAEYEPMRLAALFDLADQVKEQRLKLAQLAA